MADNSIPILKLLITPQFDKSDQATSLIVSLTIGRPELQKDSKLVTFPDTFDGVGTQHVLEASDETGKLSVVLQDSEESEKPFELSWVTERNTYGDVEIRYEVSTSSKDQFKFGGPVLGLHREQGGLLGSGFAIVPIPPLKVVYRNIVEWDLGQAPNGTRAVWTYGEGPEQVERVGPASMLRDTVYMVGYIQGRLKYDIYGFYWFGSLPPKIESIKDVHSDVLLNAQKYFVADDECEDTEGLTHAFFPNVPKGRRCMTPHSSFFRNTGSTKSFGGTSFQHSHIFNYDDQIGKVHDNDLIRRMAYEMAHFWLGPSALDNKDWLYEGIRDYLSLYMPLNSLLEVQSKRYFQSTVDMLCTRYYTSPLINLPFEEVLKLADTDAYAREHTSARAWAFVMGVDLRAMQISKDKLKKITRLDEIVLFPLSTFKARGKAHGIRQFMELLTPLMGNEIRKRYQDFCNGTTILLLDDLNGDPHQHLKHVDDFILDFGMDRESFAEGIVSGMKVGTRAAIAGFKDGDKILWSSHEWRCVDDIDQTMELMVERNGIRTRVKYWPRDFDTAKSWQMCTRTEEELKQYEQLLREDKEKRKWANVKLKITTRYSRGKEREKSGA